MIDFLHLSYILYYVIRSTKCTRDGQTPVLWKIGAIFLSKTDEVGGEGLGRRGRRYGMRRASKRREGEEGGAPAVVCVASILHAIQANGFVCSMSHGLRRASGVFVGMQSHVSDGTLIL